MVHVLGLVVSLLLAALVCIEDWYSSLNLFFFLLSLLSLSYLVVCSSALNGLKNLSDKAYLNKIKYTWRGIFFWALIFRLIVFFDPFVDRKLLSTDVYRYLWEGQVVSSGENPYYLSPESNKLLDVKQKNLKLWNKVDHKQVATIYPPGAQLLFSIVPANKKALKTLYLFWDMLSIWLLIVWLRVKKAKPEKVVFYAWMPLAILELGSSLHLEGLLIPWMILGCLLIDWSIYSSSLSRFKPSFSRSFMIFGGFLSLLFAFLIKFVAIVPIFFASTHLIRKKTISKIQLATILLAVAFIGCLFWIPFIDKSLGMPTGFKTFATHWRFNGGFFQLLESVFTKSGFADQAALYSKTTAFIITALTAVFCLLKQMHFLPSSILCWLVILVSSPVLYPWYLLWFLPLVCILEFEKHIFALLVFSCSVFLSYEVLYHPNNWKLEPGLLMIELMLPMIAFALYRKRLPA